MNVVRRLYWLTDTVREHLWLQRTLQIRSTDLVLDVGSGASPHFRSNVLCDKFVHDAAERHGAALRVDRPLVVGDVQRLPFATGSFDFVICSHVLEHVDDPAAAVSELTRVGRRGYIETPSAEWERLAGFPFHRWMVSKRDDALIFARKRRPVADPELNVWFDSLQRRLKLGSYIWWRRRSAGVYTWLLWEEHVQIEVHDEIACDADFTNAQVDVGSPAVAVPQDDLSRFDRIIERYGRIVRRHSDPTWEQVDLLLRCPRCRGPVSRQPAHFRCAVCLADYPVDDDGRPWFLDD